MSKEKVLKGKIEDIDNPILKTIKVDCRECDGRGAYDVLKCTSGASNCCGGCYEPTMCDTCGGSGKKYLEFRKDDIIGLLDGIEDYPEDMGTIFTEMMIEVTNRAYES